METVVNNHPSFFCPYLKLQRAHEFADFWIGPRDQFEGDWKWQCVGTGAG